MIIQFIIIGLAAGILSGLLGVGGGIIIVPALTMFMGFDIKQAIGTSLAIIIPTALSGAVVHYTSGNVNLFGFLFVAAGAVRSEERRVGK